MQRSRGLAEEEWHYRDKEFGSAIKGTLGQSTAQSSWCGCFQSKGKSLERGGAQQGGALEAGQAGGRELLHEEERR